MKGNSSSSTAPKSRFAGTSTYFGIFATPPDTLVFVELIVLLLTIESLPKRESSSI